MGAGTDDRTAERDESDEPKRQRSNAIPLFAPHSCSSRLIALRLRRFLRAIRTSLLATTPPTIRLGTNANRKSYSAGALDASPQTRKNKPLSSIVRDGLVLFLRVKTHRDRGITSGSVGTCYGNSLQLGNEITPFRCLEIRPCDE